MIMAINIESDSRTLSSSVAWPWKSHYMRKSVFRDLRLTDSFTARNRVGCTCLSLHCYLNTMLSRVHLAFNARIQEFSSGGGGLSQSDKKALTIFFLVLSLFYWSQMVNFESTIIFQGSRGGPTFSRGGGVQLFPGGSNCLYPIATHITCDFPGGVRTPLTPLWIRTCYLDQQAIAFFRLVVVGWFFSVLFKFW